MRLLAHFAKQARTQQSVLHSVNHVHQAPSQIVAQQHVRFVQLARTLPTVRQHVFLVLPELALLVAHQRVCFA